MQAVETTYGDVEAYVGTLKSRIDSLGYIERNLREAIETSYKYIATQVTALQTYVGSLGTAQDSL